MPIKRHLKDGVSQEQEYIYDGAGNLQKDLNKGISGVLYNHLNLPVQVELGPGRFISYFYDASGTKRRKIVQDGVGAPQAVTDYLAGGVYEKGVLEFLSTSEGRTLPPEQTGEAFFAYEYHYKDHLGNLRAAFRKAPSVPAFTATMEVASAPLEEAQFDNITKTRSSAHALNGPESGTRHSAKVNVQQVLGPWRTIAVKQGDRLQAQVFAYYESLSEPSGARAYLTAFLDNPANVPAPGEQTNNLWDKLKIGLSFPFAHSAGPHDNTLPVAYLKYLVYDQAYKPLKEDSVAITTRAAAIHGGWEALSIDFTATEEGYVQVLVANESQKPVWFDDLHVKHSPALIVQENHYDPWGLNLAGIEKQGQPDHKWQYNGKEKQDELGLGWTQMDLRMYDPQLGRFHSPDLITEIVPAITPYHFAFNNPALFSDPTGLFPENDQDFLAGGGGGKKPKPKKPGNCIQCNDKPARRSSNSKGSDNTSVSNNYIDHNQLFNTGSTQSAQPNPTAPNSSDNNSYNATTGALTLAGAGVSETVTGITLTDLLGAGASVLFRYSPLALLTLGGDTRTDVNTTTVPTTDTKRDNDNYIVLFRNFSEAEYDSYIRKGFNFGLGPNSMPVKEFWVTPTGLRWWESKDLAGPYNITISIPKSIIGPNKLVQFQSLDGHPAAIVYQQNLNAFNKAKVTISIHRNPNY